MDPHLSIEPLRVEHLPDLATVLRHPAVYQHLGGVPSLADFIEDRTRALRGPRADASDEVWLNFLVRHGASHAMLGRLEATLHDGLAEVAFLFDPAQWGQGYAQAGLSWLHAEIVRRHGLHDFWATTVPANLRCQALLRRCGYRPVTSTRPRLFSFDDGDVVFHLRHRSVAPVA